LQKEQTSAAHADICPSEDIEVEQNSIEFRRSSNTVKGYLFGKMGPLCEYNELPSVHLSVCNLISADEELVGFS
jgi:hypothetical protein